MIHFCVGSVFHIFMKDGGKGALHTGGKLKFDSNPRTYSKTAAFSFQIEKITLKWKLLLRDRN